MIIGSSTTAAVRQPGDASTTNDRSPATATDDTASVKPGTQGINRLSSQAATVVLAEQGAATPAGTASGKAADAPAATAKAPETTPPAKLDLHGQDLRAIDLSKLDLRSADLTGADLTGKDLSGVDLSGATLSCAKLDGATFSHTNLHGVTAIGASFAKASFDETDLDGGNFTEAKFTGAVFDANFQLPPTDVQTFAKCYIIKDVDLTKADFSEVTFKRDMFIKHFTADDASFAKSKFGEAIFTDGSMKGASFEGMSGHFSTGDVDATNVNFSNINGGSVYLCGGEADGATYHNSDTVLWFYGIDLHNVDLSTKNKSLRKSCFANCNMSGLDFSGYDFTSAAFVNYSSQLKITQRASLFDLRNTVKRAIFRGAKFTNAYFTNINMDKTIFDIRDLQGAYISNFSKSTAYIQLSSYDVTDLFKDIWHNNPAR